MIYSTEVEAIAAQRRYGGTIRREEIPGHPEEWADVERPTPETIRAEAQRRLDAGDPFARLLVPAWDAVTCQYHHGEAFWAHTECAISDMDEGDWSPWGIPSAIPRHKALMWLRAVVGSAAKVKSRVLQRGAVEEVVEWHLDGAEYPAEEVTDIGGGGWSKVD